MSCLKPGTTVHLTPRQNLTLADIRGTTLRVTRGTLWITQENDTQDIVLRAGDSWTVERNGLTIVEAQSQATMCAHGSAFARALGIAARPETRGARFWRHVCERAAEWYSLSPRRPIPHV